MTDTGYKPPPSPTKSLHSIPPLGLDASESNKHAQAHSQESYISVGPGKLQRGCGVTGSTTGFHPVGPGSLPGGRSKVDNNPVKMDNPG